MTHSTFGTDVAKWKQVQEAEQKDVPLTVNTI